MHKPACAGLAAARSHLRLLRERRGRAAVLRRLEDQAQVLCGWGRREARVRAEHTQEAAGRGYRTSGRGAEQAEAIQFALAPSPVPPCPQLPCAAADRPAPTRALTISLLAKPPL